RPSHNYLVQKDVKKNKVYITPTYMHVPAPNELSLGAMSQGSAHNACLLIFARPGFVLLLTIPQRDARVSKLAIQTALRGKSRVRCAYLGPKKNEMRDRTNRILRDIFLDVFMHICIRVGMILPQAGRKSKSCIRQLGTARCQASGN
ncbi:hypothetical protein H113_01639, partial [Trichophyton rubrum MR1459]